MTTTATDAADIPPPAQRVRWTLYWRLSVLWMLEWGITGAVLTYLPLYFQQNQLQLKDVGPLLAIGAVGLWIAPFVVGQVCDRWMASERYLALAHFVGGLTLIAIPMATDVYRETREGWYALLTLFGIYAAAYFPTMPLASAMTFRHLSDPRQQFGSIRIWGTIGWVLAGVGLSFWLGRTELEAWIRERRPGLTGLVEQLQYTFFWLPTPRARDSFHIAALLSFALSTFCVFLPPTPPARARHARIAPLHVLGMFRNRSFTILIVASGLLALVVPLYTLVVPELLRQLGIAEDWVPAVMTVGQVSEFPALLLLPLCLRRLGLKATFVLGIAAWVARYLLFAMASDDRWLLIGIALHGVCHVFLIIVIQIHVDALSEPHLRTSAQNLFAFLTLGVATPLGLLLSQPLIDWCTDEATGVVNVQSLFLWPALFLLVVLLGFWKLYRPPEIP